MEESGNGSLNDVVNAQFGEQTDDGTLGQELTEKEVLDIKDDSKKDLDPEFNKKFAALSRKEKEYRLERETFEKEMEEFRRAKEEFEASKIPKEEPKPPIEYRLKKDPLGTLAELGFDYETLTELALNDGKLSNEMQMKLMREEIEKELEEKYKYLEDRFNTKEKEEEELKYQNTINNFKSEIDNFIKSDVDTYELINANEANDLVYEVIEEHHKETGNVLEIKDAAEAVEAYLLEEAQKFLKLKKLSGNKEIPAEPKPDTQRQSSPTLSNDHSAQSINDADRKLSYEESIAKAASALKWT